MNAENAEVIVGEIAEVVTNLDQEDEQSEDNFGLIVGVFDEVDGLIEDGNFSTTEDVSSDTPLSSHVSEAIFSYVNSHLLGIYSWGAKMSQAYINANSTILEGIN